MCPPLRFLCGLVLYAALAAAPAAQFTYIEQGPLFNSPGTAPGGFDESILQGDEALFGFGAQASAGNTVADDFVVTSGGWTLGEAQVYAYQSFSPIVTITGATVRIHDDADGSPGSVRCMGTFVDAEASDVYRNNTSGNVDRRIQTIRVSLSGCNLGPGRYWLSTQYEGDASYSGPWQPPVAQPLGQVGCASVNDSGAQQSIGGGPFEVILNGACTADLPFSLDSGPVCDNCCQQSLTATVDDSNPSPGQRITFTVTVSNDASSAATLDLWLEATGPVSRTIFLGSGTLPAGATVMRDVRLRIPGNAPGGTYDLDLHLGDLSTSDVCDTVSFTMTIAAPRIGGGTGTTFEVLNDFFRPASTVSGDEVRVMPNPFALQTTIRYAVEATADVRLAVYDVLGREIAVLVDDRREAGHYTATFDTRGLAAGTYVYRLVVGRDVQTGQLTLTR